MKRSNQHNTEIHAKVEYLSQKIVMVRDLNDYVSPFTPTSLNHTWRIFFWHNSEKQTTPCDSAIGEVLFDWLNHKILFTHKRRYCSVALIGKMTVCELPSPKRPRWVFQ